MRVKEWLNRGWRQNNYINSLLREKEKALNDATSATVQCTDERVQNSSGNSTEQRFIKYAEYSTLIDAEIDSLVDTKNEIINVINKIDDSTLKTLLIDRYISFMTWESIATDLNYSRMQVWRLHSEALKKVEKFISQC